MSSEVRKTLLEKLLDKPVTYSDVKRHGLSEEGIRYLFEEDYVTRKEFVYMYRRRRPNAVKNAAFMQWIRERRRLARSVNKEEIDVTLYMYSKMGMNVDRVFEGYKNHLPVHRYFGSPRAYVMEFLADVRDDLYEMSMSTKDAANILGVTRRHLLRMVKQGKVETFEDDNRVSTHSLIDILQEQIREKCEVLAAVSPRHLRRLMEKIVDDLTC